jgi:hypothetical protein
MASGVWIVTLTQPARAPWTALAPVLGLFAAGMALMLMLLYRRGARSASMFAPSPLLALAAADRRRIVRVIRRSEVISGPDRQLAIAAARRVRRKGPLRLAAVTIVLQLAAAIGVGPAHGVRFWLPVAAAGCMAVSAEEIIRLQRRAARFLAANGEDS